MDVVNLADKLARFSEAWSPKIVGEVTDEVHVVLLEPKGTLNTGNVTNERTVRTPETI